MKNILILGVFLTFVNCNMSSQDKINRNEFIELHKHKGTENYEVVELFNNKMEIEPAILVDKVKQNLIVTGFNEDKLNDSKDFKTKKISNLGNVTKTSESFDVLKDGTFWASRYYSNWIINGDTTKHFYLDPFTNKEIDNPYKYNFKEKEENFDKWFKKFKELYTQAQYIYIYMSFYYFKIEDTWYLMDEVLDGSPDGFRKNYPPKEDQDIRMVPLNEIKPKYYLPPNERDTQLIREMEYQSMEYEEENWGLIKHGYSAGWWYLEIYMPLGDVIKIKRYSYFESPDLRLYKIPDAYGGRQDVLFIVQKPKDIHAAQVGGMYVIRPKDPKQPQYRYKSISYLRDKDGFKIIDKEKSVETEVYKAWVKKKQK